MENIITPKTEKLQNFLLQTLTWRSSPGRPILLRALELVVYHSGAPKIANFVIRLRNQTWKSG